MQLQGRALYNLLRNCWLEDPKLHVKPWQVEHYRELSVEALFSRLGKLGLSLTTESFLSFAEPCETPEDLAECLSMEEKDVEWHDQVYLLLFELWRKLLPNRQSLSVFCDELDHLIDLYDKERLKDEEALQAALKELEDILDESADLGQESKEVFLSLSHYCAHDLESFLYDYINTQIDEENPLYASELLDGFYSYVSDTKWFDLLKTRLFILSDPEDAENLIRGFLEEEQDLDFLFELIVALIPLGNTELFSQASQKALLLLQTAEDFHELLLLASNFFRSKNFSEKELAAQTLLETSSSHDLAKRLRQFQTLLT